MKIINGGDMKKFICHAPFTRYGSSVNPRATLLSFQLHLRRPRWKSRPTFAMTHLYASGICFTDNLGEINGETSMHFEWLSSTRELHKSFSRFTSIVGFLVMFTVIINFPRRTNCIARMSYTGTRKCLDIYHRKLLCLCFMRYTYFEILSTL